MQYQYQARDENGTLRTGTVEAITEAVAFDTLKNHGFIVISIAPVQKNDILGGLNIFNRVSAKDVVLFSRQLATLIDASVPIVQALQILEYQVTSPSLRKVITELVQKVEAGDSLSAALSQYPKVFSPLYVNLVRSSELSGTLDDAFNYLANQLEKDYDMRSKIIGSLTYPAFIVGALIIVGFLMFIYVLPPLIGVLEESSVALPFTTKILIASTNFMQKFWWLVIILMVGGGVGLRYYSQTFGGKYAIDYIKIKTPFIGGIFQKIYMARFSRNLATLVSGGIPIVKALESVADIIGNQVYHDVIMDAAQQVRNGKSIAVALVDKPEFPPIISQMTQIGETTGKLHEILDKLASFYEKEVNTVLSTLTTLLEPAIMILLGLAVAVMVAGILLPIYNLAGAQ
ncbi:MAG: type II secretion system F family protein [Candidatus Doudnabacteria bacterium]|nr:type II secretion system F family protein [Candidatus Doudnabacteria bacterium]